jgi:hypothetical protein
MTAENWTFQKLHMNIMLVFYVGYILDDKNTLCNDCYLNRIIGLIQNLQVSYMDSVNFKPCALSKVSRRCS